MKTLCALVSVLLAAPAAYAQLSGGAYRVLGQPDTRQNGINRVLGVEMHSPGGVAIDGRAGAARLYVSDTRNHRVLAWPDVRSYQVGDPPAITLGQPTPQHSAAMGIGAKGFNGPMGMAVDPLSGNLYVADTGNNRVLRFPNPFSNPARVEPDAVYGQPDFDSRGANAGGVNRNSMNAPRSVAFDPSGNLWVADTANHRVLRFNVAVLDRVSPEPDLVLGQRDFTGAAPNRGAPVSASGLDTPVGVAADAQGNVYVSDFNNLRVLKFAIPFGPDAAAVAVFGQPGLTSTTVPVQASAATLEGPAGLVVDGAGDLYVTVPGDNRIMVFAANAASGTAAKDVLGQPDFTSTLPNAFSFPLAAARGFSGAMDIKADADGNLYVADTGNHRVVSFPRGSKNAASVWGQIDFSGNGIDQVKAGGMNAPLKAAIDYSQTPYALYVSDSNNHRVLVWKDATSFRSGDPADMVIGQPDFTVAVANVDTRGSVNPSRTSLSTPKGIAVDAYGNLYVADSGNNRVLRYPRPVNQTGRVEPDVVIGQADFNSSNSAAVNASSLRAPSGVALGPDGSLFVSDTGNNRVLEYAPGAGTYSAAIRVYGQPHFTASVAASPASAQTMQSPRGAFVDASYTLYVADTGNNRLLVFPNTREAMAAGMPASVVLGQDNFENAGEGGGANRFRAPADVVVDNAGNVMVADSGNHRVLVFPSLLFAPLAGAAAEAVLGQRDLNSSAPNWNAADGMTSPEGLFGPQGLLLDRQNTLYVADARNNRLAHFLKPADVRHAANPQPGVPVGRGGMAFISGAGFTDAQEVAAGTPLPVSLAGREVVLNDEVRVPLASVTPDSISLQIPSSAATGTQRIALRSADTRELIAGSTVMVSASSPGLFAGGDSRFSIFNQDGTQNSSSNPAVKGNTIRIFGTGQGPVSPSVNDGDATPADQPVATIAVPTSDGAACLTRQPSVCVAIGNTFGDIQFSGLAPGMVGIWQLTVRLPVAAPSGNAVPLRAVINGVPSNIITVAIR